jgi:protein translocase SecG subunit
MKDFLLTAELIIAILLAVSILLQHKNSSMGSMAGEDTENFSTKRGAEKVLHNASVVLAVLFALVAAIFPFFG